MRHENPELNCVAGGMWEENLVDYVAHYLRQPDVLSVHVDLVHPPPEVGQPSND